LEEAYCQLLGHLKSRWQAVIKEMPIQQNKVLIAVLLHALWTDNRRRPIVVGLLKAKNSARTTYILHWLRQRYT